MKIRTIGALLLAVALALCPLGGCATQMPLWQWLEQQQYNRYKPQLDYMVEKYGPLFQMDVYGSVSCTEPAYQDWRLRLGSSPSSFTDNFAARLHREELEARLQQLAQPVLGPCKVYLTGSRPCSLGEGAEMEQFFTSGLLEFCLCLPYGQQPQRQGQALLEALEQCQYRPSRLKLLFFEETQYQQADRALAAAGPEGYRCCLEADFNQDTGEFDLCWKQNYALEALTEKYGPLFQMDASGAISCTQPEYQDWPLALTDYTALPVLDNFAARLRRDELEAYLQQLAQPALGQCKVYLTQSRPCALGPEASPEDFFAAGQQVGFRIYAPYGDRYKTQGEGVLLALLEHRYQLTELEILFLDQEAYRQAGRSLAQSPPEGYRFCLDISFDSQTGKAYPLWRPAPERP